MREPPRTEKFMGGSSLIVITSIGSFLCGLGADVGGGGGCGEYASVISIGSGRTRFRGGEGASRLPKAWTAWSSAVLTVVRLAIALGLPSVASWVVEWERWRRATCRFWLSALCLWAPVVRT